MSTPAAKWLPAAAAIAVIAVVVIAGLGSGGNSSADSNPGAVGGTALTVPASTAPPVVVATDPAVPKTQLDATLGQGMQGEQVKMVQTRLKELGFDPGPLDGAFGLGTKQAVWAFEKLTNPAIRYDQVTGQVTNDMWQLMQDDLTFTPRRPGGPGTTHMEIYLDRQVGIVFTDDKVRLITHLSSGELDASGQPAEWCDTVTYDTDSKGNKLTEPVDKAVCGIAKTPGGVFKFYRRDLGHHVSPLGGMWNPVYLNYGIAVHGAENVPDAPASHGCIRIPMFISEYFPDLVKNGDLVYVWDGVKEPEQQSKKDMLPVFDYPDPTATTTTTSTTTTTTTTPPTTAAPATTVRATVPPAPAPTPARTVPPTAPPTAAPSTTSSTPAAPASSSPAGLPSG